MNHRNAIIITGPVGSGKSTTAKALAELLEHNDVSCAFIEMDALSWFHPTSPDDPFGSRVGYRHLAMMVETYREMGIPTLILAGVVENDTRKYADAMPNYDIMVIRLDVSFDRLDDRLRDRETEDQVPWHLNRARELQAVMEANGVGDIVLPIAEQSPHEVAREIAERLDLL